MRILALWLLASCNSGPGDSGGGTTPTGTTSTVTTTQSGFCAAQAVFASKCTICHSPDGGSQGNLDLQTDPIAALVGQPSPGYPGRTLVVAGDPDASFLIAKVAGTQGADGGPMPAPDGLDAARVEILRAWIADGATAGCDTTPTGTGDYHPDGFEDPAEHGVAAKFQEQACTTCHGDQLDGGTAGVSCDSCHAPDWRTDCTYCHGGVETADGAPPENIDDTPDAASLAAFPVHTKHVTETIHAAFDCTECHVKPADPLTPGHLFVGDVTAGLAEVAFARGGSYAVGTCSNQYCHGNGQGNNGTADASFVSTCDACHADWSSGENRIAAMSGEHVVHVWDQGFDCSECHPQTVDAAHQFVDPLVHVDGAPTVDPAGTIAWNAANGTCTGACHGEGHANRQWN